MSLIEPGKKAPAFSLKDQVGETHRLSDYAGQLVVLLIQRTTPRMHQRGLRVSYNLPRFKTNKAVVPASAS
jgi:peroxiredoxin